MLSCTMRLTFVTVIACYSVGFQRMAAAVLYPVEPISGEATFDTGGLANSIVWRFPFLGQIRNSFKISKDGYFTFDTGDLNVAVNIFRTTITLATDSRVWWRLTNDATTLAQVSQIFQPYFSVVGSYTFNANSVVIVTWHRVLIENKPHTFQMVLATDGVASFAMFNYDKIPPCGGTIVKVGFNSPGNVLYTHPLESVTSRTQFEELSNIGVAGRWLYRVDGRGVLEPDCVGFSISTETGTSLKAPISVGGVLAVCSGNVVPSTSTATSFLLVPCNANGLTATPLIPGVPCVSIVPVFAPNLFVRHSSYILQLCTGDSSDTFKRDSSFFIRPDTFKNGFLALQSYNFPLYYIQFLSATSDFRITFPGTSITTEYNNSASFTLRISPSCPYGNDATWCSTIETNLCSQAPFDLLCRATCHGRTTTTATTTTTTTTTTQPTTTTTGVVLKLTKCARPAYRSANPEFCKNWFPFNRRPYPARWSNWAGPRAAPWAVRGAGRRFW